MKKFQNFVNSLIYGKLNHTNLSDYLSQKISSNEILYYQKNDIYNESGSHIKIIWTIDYQSVIAYDKKTRKWTVKFIDQLCSSFEQKTISNKKIIELLLSNESFRDRTNDYNYRTYGFKLLNTPEDFKSLESDFIVTLSSKKLNKIIDFPLCCIFVPKMVEI